MSDLTYGEIFRQAFDDHQRVPYSFQCRLAGGVEAATAGDFHHGTACRSQLIEIPTGLGKTAAVVLAWLWNRALQPDEAARAQWPRRLVYCLPMRTLVEQTRDEIRRWILRLARRLTKPRDGSALRWLALRSPIILMGGENAGGWDVHPEREAILIGTQDMLLSRALNRGYGMSRYRWPVHFGLLNNDALWVLDETQLMGPALWTSAQLDWMRHERFSSLFACPTWWMSATVGDTFLKTSDRVRANFPMPQAMLLGDEPNAAAQLGACRPCELWRPAVVAKNTSGKKKAEAADTASLEADFAAALGHAVVAGHQPGTLSLVVCNTVRTAQSVFATINASKTEKIPCILLTSRFRKKDRADSVKALLAFERKRKSRKMDVGTGLICVSTQVVEAGVDVSAAQLWSEVAPWSSLVQRLGRLNRDGRDNGTARANFFKVPVKDARPKKGAKLGPYNIEAVIQGERILTSLVKLTSAEPKLPSRAALARLHEDKAVGKDIAAALQPALEPYPRAIDVHGLFSTEPDVFGGFTDVSSFVRGADDDADVTVFWRTDDPKRAFAIGELDGPAFEPAEGVTVPLHRLRVLLGTRARAHLWNDKTERWEPMRGDDLRPGMVLLLRASTGGYDPALGWTGNSHDKLANLAPAGPFAEKFDDDRFTQTGEWMELSKHLDMVRSAAEKIADQLALVPLLRCALVTAARYHDIGKCINQWQGALPQPPFEPDKLWAKAPFLLVVRGGEKGFAAAEVEALLREAGIEASPGDASALNDAANSLCWHVRRKVTNTRKRAWLDDLRRIAGVTRVWHKPFRPGLRHEAASALALWHRYFREGADFPALAIYLAAAHHGKVRTVLTSREMQEQNVCGVPTNAEPLRWESGMPMDFACAADGSAGTFSADGTEFESDSPGWTSLIADLLGDEACRKPTVPLSIRTDEPRSLGPFQLAYLESLIVAADVAGSKVWP